MADTGFHHGRHAGVLIPLFSIPSRASWGVGEIADLPLFARWLARAGLDLVQLLPVNEMEEGQNSPYSALSAMAIDPVFIALREVEEFADAGGEAALDATDRERIEEVRRLAAVDFRTVRALKRVALHHAFHAFRQRYAAGTARAAEFQAFAERERWWLDDYALFRALHDEHHGCYWRDWEPELRDRDPLALARARLRLADAVLYYQYLQWLADTQWRRARRGCGSVGIFGDFPFMVSGHSADVWSRQHQFRIDASVGVPPDATSETGQDWGLPVYRWEVMRHDDYDWLRQRARRSTDLYSGFRVDHLVGF
jgi:4-alpha-glucanotransferase